MRTHVSGASAAGSGYFVVVRHLFVSNCLFPGVDRSRATPGGPVTKVAGKADPIVTIDELSRRIASCRKKSGISETE